MKLSKKLILFLIGGISYYLIEILWRGYSHLSMFMLGGICFVLIGLINEFYDWNMPLWKQMLIACLVVTVAEFVAGVILNIWLGLDIWDYSNLTFNLLGQISLQYSILWFFLSLPAIVLDDWLRYWLFEEERPHYKFI
jgi:uncharacterized membrane protein